MAAVIPTYLRGLMRPDPRLEFWAAQSGEYASDTTTRLAALPQGGPFPGIPDPQVETEMVLQSSGSQSRDKLLRVYTINGGFPDRGGASLAWCYDGEDYRGWDAPTTLAAFEEINWTTSSATSGQFPHALTLASGRILVAAQSGVPGASGCDVLAWIRDPGTGAWSSAALDGIDDNTENLHPCLVLLPSGRVLCFMWLEDTAAATANIRMLYSDDDGDHWDIGQDACLTTAIDVSSTSGAGNAGFDLGRLRAAYKDGQILLVAQTRAHDTLQAVEDSFIQYASDDLGASFTLVETWDLTASQGGNYQDILVSDGKFLFFFLSTTTPKPFLLVIANAFDRLLGATSVGIAGDSNDWGTLNVGTDFFDDGDLAACKDEAGNVYVTGRQPTATNQWVISRSADGGATWESLGSGSGGGLVGKWCDLGDAATYPFDACATFQRGRMVVIHSLVSSPGTADESLCASFLGGYSTVTMPGLVAYRSDANQVSFDRTYLPFDVPDDVGWTLTGAGSGTLTAGRLVLVTAAAEARSYTLVPTGTIAEGCIVEASWHVTGGATSYIDIRLADGTNGYGCMVEISTGAITATDTVSSTQIGTAAHANPTDGIHVRIAMQDNACTVWYRSFDTASDRVWTQLGQRLAMSDNGATWAANRVRWGQAVSVGGVTTEWRLVQYVFGAYAGTGTLADGQSNPLHLFGRPYSSIGTYVDDGVVVRALDGPTYRSDLWNIDTDYTHPVTNLLPQNAPSPRTTWRSSARSGFNASTAYLHIAFKLDQNSADSYIGNDLCAFLLEGMNCAALKVDFRYAGAWNNVTTTGVHAFTGVRNGNVVRPNTTSTLGNKYRLGEYADAGIGFYSAGYTVADWIGTIRTNTEGITNTNGVTTKRAAFYLDEESSGSSTTPAVGIWPRRQFIVVHPSGFASSIEAIRIRIPVTAAAVYPGIPDAGYYEIGKVLFGPLAVFGFDTSIERTLTIEANTELITLRNGARRSRVLGPSRRGVDLTVAEVDIRDVRTETAPDYVKASANASAEPVAFHRDLPLQICDLVRDMDGPDELVVYIPHVDYDSNSGSSGNVASANTNYADGVIYGRLMSPASIKQVAGDDEVDEVYTVTGIEIAEEV